MRSRYFAFKFLALAYYYLAKYSGYVVHTPFKEKSWMHGNNYIWVVLIAGRKQ